MTAQETLYYFTASLILGLGLPEESSLNMEHDRLVTAMSNSLFLGEEFLRILS